MISVEVVAEDIVKHNVAGPYTLQNIEISDADTGLAIADTTDYTTAAYQVSAFEPLDSDGDGLSDNLELSIGSDINQADSDFDGVSDYDEVAFDGDAVSYNPTTDLNPISTDTDSDGMDDGWEINLGYAPLVDDGAKNNDDDSDGLNNLEEFQNSTLPNEPDTDGDGINDMAGNVWEWTSTLYSEGGGTRGGGWNYITTVSARRDDALSSSDAFLGFRVCR